MWARSFRKTLGFAFQAAEEPSGHHAGGTLDHALAHAGEQAAHVNIARVQNGGFRTVLAEFQLSGSFHKSRLALAFEQQLVMLRCGDVLEGNCSGEYPNDRTNSSAELGVVLVLTGFLHLLAARNAFLQDGGIDEGREDALARCAYSVGAFYFQATPLTTSEDTEISGWASKFP